MRVTSPERALGLLLPAAMALYACFNGVQAILVPDRIEAIDPASKVADVAVLRPRQQTDSRLARGVGEGLSGMHRKVLVQF